MNVPENEAKKQQFWVDQCQEIAFEGINMKERVSTRFSDQDQILFTVTSDDIWISLTCSLACEHFLIEANMDLKVSRQMPWNKLRQIAQKLLLQFWNNAQTKISKSRFETAKTQIKNFV